MKEKNESIPTVSEVNSGQKSNFSYTLEIIALVIITVIIAVLFVAAFSFLINYNSEKLPNTQKIELSFIVDSSSFKTSSIRLTSTSKDSLISIYNNLNIQFNKFQRDREYLESLQDKNENQFKFLLIILGSVFSIVGFFGFKSINDTRDAAISRAELKAEEASQKKATTIAENTVRDEINRKAKDLIKQNIDEYFNQNKGEILRDLEGKYKEDMINDIMNLKNKFDTISGANKFSSNEQPEFYKKLREEIEELNTSVQKFKNEFDTFKRDEFKDNIIAKIKQDLDKQNGGNS